MVIKFLVLRILILNPIKDEISEQSTTSDNNLRKHFEGKNKRRLLSCVKLRQFKTLSHDEP